MQLLSYFLLRVRVWQICLICKEKHWKLPVADVYLYKYNQSENGKNCMLKLTLVFKEQLKLVLGHCETKIICGVDHEDDSFG